MPEAAPVRVVDQITIHGQPMTFGALLERAVPADAQYIVLDLDKTCFLGLNMGEMLGWELIARDAYGDARLDALEGRRQASRFLLDWSRPAKVARYLARGASAWGWPGLRYLFGLKLPMKWEASSRWAYQRFGADPVKVMQHIPQMNLLHQLSEVPLERLATLSERLLAQHQGSAVVTPEDIAQLRQRAPGATILLSSGSPGPVVEAAAAWLGVDDCFYTRIEVHEGYLSAPPVFRALSADVALPRRIAPRETIQINTGLGKIAQLRARYPGLFAPGVVSVGVTDTDHGEDHCWAEHFSRVIDVNSSAPFSPLIGVDSPLRSIHSASVLSRDGRHGRAAEASRVWTRRDLGPALSEIQGALDELMVRLERCQAEAPPSSAALARAQEQVDEAIEAYNAGPEQARGRRLATLKEALAAQKRAERALIQEQAEAAALHYEVQRLKALAREHCAQPGASELLEQPRAQAQQAAMPHPAHFDASLSET